MGRLVDIEDVKAFLKEKFEYNSEQAEIWREGSDKDSYFRQQKDLYMDRANIYGEVMREIDRLSEEYKGGWIPCSERLPEVNVPILTCDKEGWISVNINIPYLGGVKNDFECGYYVAWMPLPTPYQPKGENAIE